MMQNMNNLMGMMNSFRGFMQNPGQILSEKVGIPKQYLNNPDQVIQYLMDNGKLSQDQYNQAKQMAQQMQNNPMFQQMFKR